MAKLTMPLQTGKNATTAVIDALNQSGISSDKSGITPLNVAY